MPNHYRKKKMPRNKKKTQHGGQKKKLKMCMCHQKGGMLLSPAQLKMLQRPVRKFSTLPVKMKQKGMGHGCMCKQCGGNIFDDIGGAFKSVGKSIVSNPLRLAAGISTLGLSETFLTPAELLGKATGTKTSKLLEKAVPVITAVGAAQGAPSLGKAAGFTAKGLKMMGLGSRRVVRQPILV
jgi:hypothetical protein